ncbi:MAG: diguanylate cyclase [Myxococcales bacterium]|nr:diguanylate cyclase [Myxococcales bacterium]
MANAEPLAGVMGGGMRATRSVFAPSVIAATMAYLARGGFGPSSGRGLDAVALLALLAALAVRRRPRARRRDGTMRALDPVRASVGVTLAATAVAATGGSAGPLSALPFLALAAAGSVVARRHLGWVFAVGLLCELSLHYAAHGFASLGGLALRVAVAGVAVALHHGLTRAEVARVRARAGKMLADQETRQREAAASFRLAGSASGVEGARRDEAARMRASLEEIHASVVGLLGLGRRTLGLRTCALFWVDARGRTLRLVEAATDDAELVTEPISAGAGALGAAVSLGRPVVLSNLKPEYPGLPYYRGPHGVREFAGVPIRDGDEVRGVLVADRAEARALTPDDLATLEMVALQARRLIDNERVFARLDRARTELSVLFDASRALGEALTDTEVLDAVVRSARAVVEHDLIVVTGYDARARQHQVRTVVGEAGASLEGLRFSDNTGIASAAVKARHALPYRGQYDPSAQFVFTREVHLRTMHSVLVLPLVARDTVLGTLTLAAERRGAFGESARQLLGVLAAHASVALANAAAVRHLEALATTDPMTGHLNKRSMETEFDKRVRAAERFERPLAVIVLDIDKFKSVNDTYGHALGDVVIKGLGAVLSRCRRETDAVARFGGEEFVIVCEETDTRGAWQLAERIREELQRQTFATEMGPLRVTCSLGISAYPTDGSDRQTLFERADQALYKAKQGGRNQTRTASPLDAKTPPARGKRPPRKGVAA